MKNQRGKKHQGVGGMAVLHCAGDWAVQVVAEPDGTMTTQEFKKRDVSQVLAGWRRRDFEAFPLNEAAKRFGAQQAQEGAFKSEART